MWTVAPHVNPDAPVGRLKVNYLDSANFSFDHTREIVVSLTEEFLEHCTEGALSIEVRNKNTFNKDCQKPFCLHNFSAQA